MKKIILLLAISLVCISVYSQGQIGGSRSNWSDIRSTINTNFDTLYKRSEFVSVKEFGAVGDGITDDATAIQNAFNYARDNNKNIIFEKNKHYIISAQLLTFYGGIIEGNGAIIESTYNSSGQSSIIRCSGVLNTFYNLTENAVSGLNFIKSSTLTGLVEGDLIKIISNKVFDDTGVQGEICQVSYQIGDTIYLSEKLNDTYLISDVARVAKINYKQFELNNLNLLQNKNKSMPTGTDGTFGVQLYLCKNPSIKNSTFQWCRYASIYLDDCYSPYINNCISGDANLTGLGYGVQVYNATMNSIIENCDFFGRHAVTHNGISGVPWNSLVKNVYGVGVKNVQIFDTHAETGKCTFDGCIAVGGVIDDHIERFKGIWDSGTTYSEDEIVSFGGMFFELNKASSINENPTTNGDWIIYNNEMEGFGMSSNNVIIKNCEVINCYVGINMTKTNSSNIFIEGLKLNNCAYGVNFYQTTIDDWHINNLYVKNNYYKSNTYIFRILESEFLDHDIGIMNGENIGGVFVSSYAGGDIKIKSIKCSGLIADIGTLNSETNLFFNNIDFIGLNTNQAIRIDNTNFRSLNIGKFKSYNNVKSLIDVRIDVDYINIDDLYIEGNAAAQYYLYTGSGYTLSNLHIGNVYVKNSINRPLISNNGTISKSKISNIIGNISDVYSINNPTLEILSGHFNNPYISRGSGSPEGVVTAGIGSLYYRYDGGANTTLYVKESGTGNIGWVAK